MGFKKVLIVICAFVGCSASAQTPWLTVVGDSADASVDTIEVDPNAVATYGDQRTLRIRVSRSHERTSSDAIVFRSYRALVLFDCTKRSARFVSSDFYQDALWQGEPHASKVYAKNVVRPMAFRGIEPNPAQRLLRAACTAAPASRTQNPNADKK